MFENLEKIGNVMVKALYLGIVECVIELQSCYYVHFRIDTYGLNITTKILLKNGFDII